MTGRELEKCIELYGKDIYSFCRYLTQQIQEADDLYQDTFLKAIELREKIDFQENPRSYLLSITTRLWNNRKRKAGWRSRIARQQRYIDEAEITGNAVSVFVGENTAKKAMGENSGYRPKEEGNSDNSPEKILLDLEKRSQVRQAVKELPEKYRIVILLHYMEELGIEEIAGICELPNGTVKSRLHQARKMLKKRLEAVLHEK